MKITIEPTENITIGERNHSKVSIETSSDDLHVSEMMNEIRSLLLAWGYQPQSIDEYISLE